MAAPDRDRLERFLDELVVAVAPLGPRRQRGVLAETEAHLRDAVREGTDRGLTESEAVEQALARFGPARALARAEREQVGPGLRDVLGAAVSSGWWVASLGAVAVGVSGAVAGLLRVVFGAAFLVAAPSADRLTPAACAGWLDGGAGSCRDAAVRDWVSEVVGYRLALGVLGALALLAWRVLRRRGVLPPGLPRAVTDAVLLTAFAVGALVTLAPGMLAVTGSGGAGSGQWFSATAVALAAALVFAGRLVGDVRDAIRPVAR